MKRNSCIFLCLLPLLASISLSPASFADSNTKVTSPKAIPQWRLPDGAPSSYQGAVTLHRDGTVTYDTLNIGSENMIRETDTDRHQVGNPLDAFGALSPVVDPSAYPYEANCKVRSTFSWGVEEVCGTLIDPYVVLTAGHCIYHDNGTGTWEWASGVEVFPAYDDGPQDYGSSNWFRLIITNEWVTTHDLNYDMGWIELSRPMGVIARWLPVGQMNDAFFGSGSQFYSVGYPAVTPYDGCCQYEWGGTLDAVYPLTLRINNQAYSGQSGSGLAYAHTGPDSMYGVLSHGSMSWTGFVRMTAANYARTNGLVIGTITPTVTDLRCANVRPGTDTVAVGDFFSYTTVDLFNYSTVPWSGDVDFVPILSTNIVIDEFDMEIDTLGPLPANLAPKGKLHVLMLPFSLSGGYVPLSIPPGDYYLGMKLLCMDGDQNNNYSRYTEVRRIHIAPHVPLDCSEAILLTSSQVYHGTTIGAPSEINSYDCTYDFDGPERVHKIQVPTATDLQIKLYDMSPGLGLILLESFRHLIHYLLCWRR